MEKRHFRNLYNIIKESGIKSALKYDLAVTMQRKREDKGLWKVYNNPGKGFTDGYRLGSGLTINSKVSDMIIPTYLFSATCGTLYKSVEIVVETLFHSFDENKFRLKEKK